MGLIAASAATGLSRWALRLGGPGLIVIGLIDNSVVPIPGGMDLFVILLTARNRGFWLYYALMAVAGAMIGGFFTYRLARKGGKEGLEKKVGKRRAEKVYKRFEKSGFSTVLIGSVLPPPFPMVPVLMAAGVLQYPDKKFLIRPWPRTSNPLYRASLSRTPLRHGDRWMVVPVLQAFSLCSHSGSGRGWRCRPYLFQVVPPPRTGRCWPKG